MKSQEDRQAGQVLVQVALMMVVLLGFLALTVDVSQVYLKRRQLQNAADAGALEGARQICFENLTATDAQVPARDTALLNAPEATAVASGSGWQMTVVVNQQIPSFVASVVGQDVFNPGATATAVCGRADRAVGGLWPLSIQIDEYDDMACGELFYVFTDQTEAQAIDCDTECFCEFPIPGYGTPTRIGPGERGFLRFFDPPNPQPDYCEPHDCGNNELRCWVRNDHPGPVSICDRIPSQPGVQASVQSDVNSRVGDTVNIVLWDNSLTCPGPTLGTCPGTQYPVAGFGCITIRGWTTVDFPSRNPPPPFCKQNVKVILAEKQCPCESYGGSTGGTTPGPSDVRSVSLVD